MAAASPEGDAHMEELVDHGLGMEETDQGLLRRPSLRETYHSDSLLAPDADFITDDRSSATSGLDVADRLTYLEQRMQMQEDEIQLLKMALADVLKRLNISEEHQAAAATATGRRPTGAKARPVSLALPSRPPMGTSSAYLKKSSTLPSSATSRNYSPTPPRSGGKSPLGSVKDSPCKSTKSRPTSSASKKPEEGNKSKEAAVSVGSRRVTHCKVTMQIYLSPLTRKTGSSEDAKLAARVPTSSGSTANPHAKGGSKPQGRKTPPSFSLNLKKTTNSQHTVQDDCLYKSPVKSPSQYFQICY
ncbi:echinoderm microtubule-associated protein-like 1 isoform X5 [Takifugu rubripes]|uniref:Echinoderm microtubule-associated protein-like 1 n=2 Tax=Takifugu TaxID=31032 RepID=A0A674PIR5_TAKRU|nr:echinoderm microtubule-associated protein-like 1 isoform X5 [Takifugu rubripes]XP_056872419.1 echinoderm microtubule-associated protein-like 1 isoform X5 [Takifugu flavidus]TWW69075.1 Echinoderm microtubule-associated protein-like 1 [Takifugu flavidus]|eukprot:XP_003971576.1 PREDICTED: echinoderm microtubule-associated protein-like 1 [Takifugu rubripes]